MFALITAGGRVVIRSPGRTACLSHSVGRKQSRGDGPGKIRYA